MLVLVSRPLLNILELVLGSEAFFKKIILSCLDIGVGIKGDLYLRDLKRAVVQPVYPLSKAELWGLSQPPWVSLFLVLSSDIERIIWTSSVV